MLLALFTTWTTYGTWLPGDERGWFDSHAGLQEPNLMRQLESAFRMTEVAVTLDSAQRKIVEMTITKHCEIRQWTLIALNCRSNHIHVIIAGFQGDIEVPREQFKA